MARDLVADLGGKEALSAQKLALLDEAVLTKLILASVNMWIVKQRTLVHRQKVLPVVMQRNSLAISPATSTTSSCAGTCITKGSTRKEYSARCLPSPPRSSGCSPGGG